MSSSRPWGSGWAFSSASVFTARSPATVDDEAELITALAFGLILSFAAAAVLLLSGIEAPYGRYAVGASKVWGCKIPGKAAWVLQELPNLVAIAICLVVADSSVAYATPNMVLLGLFGFHYTNRTLVFPFLIRGGKPTTFVPFISALLYCSLNGYAQARTLTYTMRYPADWATDPRFIAGVTIWGLGFGINYQADAILRNLRKPGETGYRIPQGGMFEYVSAANYFGEIVEWSGFALAAWNLPALAFAICTACNLGPRAIQHHGWYRNKFKEDYPKTRKAIIPFIL